MFFLIAVMYGPSAVRFNVNSVRWRFAGCFALGWPHFGLKVGGQNVQVGGQMPGAREPFFNRGQSQKSS